MDTTTTKTDSVSSKVDAETVPIDGMTADQLNALIHELTAKRLIEALRCQIADEEGNLWHMVPAGIFQAALRFLVDNKVTGLSIPGSAVDAVKEAYKAKAPFKLTGTE